MALFNPAAVAVYRDKPPSPRNTVEATVAELDSRGPVIRGAPGLAADITAESAAELRLTPGDHVYFSEGAGGHGPSEPVTVRFAGAINGLNRPPTAGAHVGSITSRDARGSCHASN